MLTEKSVRQFIEATLAAESPCMSFIREKTNELNIDHEEIFSSQMAFFKVLCAAGNAQQILELGTFMGYSTAGFAEFLREKESKGHITTIERDSDRSKQAKRWLATDGLDKYVTFIVGDDHAECQRLLGEGKVFDFIFLDTWEANYPKLYPVCIELLKPQGILVVDNVLMLTVDAWHSGQNVTERNDDPTLSALRDLLRIAASDQRVITSVVPFGSGLLVCSKK